VLPSRLHAPSGAAVDLQFTKSFLPCQPFFSKKCLFFRCFQIFHTLVLFWSQNPIFSSFIYYLETKVLAHPPDFIKNILLHKIANRRATKKGRTVGWLSFYLIFSSYFFFFLNSISAAPTPDATTTMPAQSHIAAFHEL